MPEFMARHDALSVIEQQQLQLCVPYSIAIDDCLHADPIDGRYTDTGTVDDIFIAEPCAYVDDSITVLGEIDCALALWAELWIYAYITISGYWGR